MPTKVTSKSHSSNATKQDSYSSSKKKSSTQSLNTAPPKKSHTTTTIARDSSKVKPQSETIQSSKVGANKGSSSTSKVSSKNSSLKRDTQNLILKKDSSSVAVKNSVNASKNPSGREQNKTSSSHSSSRPSRAKEEKYESVASKSSSRKNEIRKEQEQSNANNRRGQSNENSRKGRSNENNRNKQQHPSNKSSRSIETGKSGSVTKDDKSKESSKSSTSSQNSDFRTSLKKSSKSKEKNDSELNVKPTRVKTHPVHSVENEIPELPKTEAMRILKNDKDNIAEKIDLKEVPAESSKKQPLASDEIMPNVDPSHNSLETLESGISMTSPNDLSDGEVEESISSRLVEVDEMDLNMEDPSPPSSSNEYLRFSSSRTPSHSDSVDKKEPEEMDENEGLDYEEDFEDYESDFDDDDEEEEEIEPEEDEESENDSDEGNESEDDDEISDGDDENLNAEPDPQMKAILRAIEAENNRPKMNPKPSEGSEDNPRVETEASPVNSTAKPDRPKTSKAYVNFARAKEKAKINKASQKLKNRGQLLQEMIQLDSVSIDLFSQVSESYETYIAAFGSSNSTQVGVQTNEDALFEAIQTDPVNTLEKWTQKPIHIPVIGDSLPTPQDYLGVGGNSLSEEKENYAAYNAISSDNGRLSKFLAASSQVVLMFLEEETLENEESAPSGQENENLGFSRSGIALGPGITSVLEGRPCNFVTFCPSDASLLLSGHGVIDPNNNEAPTAHAVEQHFGEGPEEGKREAEENLDCVLAANGALLCLWCVRQPSFPKRIMTCRSPPLVAAFSPGRPRVVMAGLNDGSLAAWDLRESPSRHPLTIVIANSKWRLSPPSYITACSLEDVIEGSAIVALETVSRDEEEEDVSNFGSFQVVSLSSSGQLTWWVLVREELRPVRAVDADNPGISSELGAAPWSRITLSRAASVSISHILQGEDALAGPNLCYDLKFSGNDPNQLYVATANGNVINFSRHNIKMHPPYFTPELEPGTAAVSISVCPHDPHYFLVGGADGLIRLHCATSASQLTCWQSSTNPAAIRKVEWSPSRPCVFYMLDMLGKLHIWDLSAGDIYPVISVEDGGLIGGQLISFNIAGPTPDNNQTLFAAFASDSGAVGIRSIPARFLRTKEEDYKKELERFKCYVNII